MQVEVTIDGVPFALRLTLDAIAIRSKKPDKIMLI